MIAIAPQCAAEQKEAGCRAGGSGMAGLNISIASFQIQPTYRGVQKLYKEQTHYTGNCCSEIMAAAMEGDCAEGVGATRSCADQEENRGAKTIPGSMERIVTVDQLSIST